MVIKQNKILLIEPPFCRLFKDTFSLDRFPLSLGYLSGTILKETDWNVMIYNADFFAHSDPDPYKISYITGIGFGNYMKNLKELSGQIWKEVKSNILAYKPTVVGISAKSQNFASARIVAKIVKEINKQIIVIVGGPHPSMAGREVLLNCPDIDICVKGEGERTIVELLNAIANKRDFKNIQGIFYRNNSEIIESAPRDFIKDLDTLCFPNQGAYKVLMDYEKYPTTAFNHIFSARGCPYNCFFCGSRNIWSRKVRFRSNENVIEEIKDIRKEGLRSVNFEDDTFGVSDRRINDLCNAIIKHCPELKWKCEIPVKLVKEKNISLMKNAGCYQIQMGIESGNNEILKRIRKNITIEEAISACKIINKYGIELILFFMVGFPYDTEDTINDTLAAMKKIKCNKIEYSIFTPYPGTEAFEICKENGLIDDNYDVSLFNHQSPNNCFCINLTHERFRMLVSKCENYVDRKNKINRIKQIFSTNSIWRIKEIGMANALQKGIKMLFR